MACIQMAGVLIGGQPLTHRARVLIGGQLLTHQAMVNATIISFLYTFILIPLNKYILFFIEVKANRVNRKKQNTYILSYSCVNVRIHTWCNNDQSAS